MNENTFGIIEVSLIFGIVLALAFWELYSLSRHKKRDKNSTEIKTQPDENS